MLGRANADKQQTVALATAEYNYYVAVDKLADPNNQQAIAEAGWDKDDAQDAANKARSDANADGDFAQRNRQPGPTS